MNLFERALEDCLDRLAGGEAGMEDCLRDHPEFAAELRPLLQAASRVKRGADVLPSPEFRQRGRVQLMAQLRAHPPRPVTARAPRLLPVYRLAVGLAALALVVLGTGTALAQSALPGSPLYGWKLAGEAAWRAVSPDPVGTDLALAERRTQELLGVSRLEREVALQGYREVLARLKNQTDPAVQERIISALVDQRERLAQAGITVPDLDEYLSSQLPSPPSPLLPLPTPAFPGLTSTPALPGSTSTPALPFDVPSLEIPMILETPIP